MKRVLVIDDELDICLMVSKHLQNLRFETDYALTVKDSHVKMSNATFDLMLVDLNLTDGSGFDVIRYAAELNLNSKIIVISAYDNEASKSLEKGATLFIPKPFTIKTINEALKKLHFLPG
jgi:DNA-binding response OmpR family regulator